MRIRFRSTFLATLLVFVGATAFLVGATSYYSAKVTAQDLTDRVLEQTSARVEKEVHELTSSAVKVSALNRVLLEEKQIGAHDFPRLVAYWAAVMDIESKLTSVFIGLEDTGECTGVSRLTGKLSVWETSRNAAGALDVREFYVADYPKTPFAFDPSKPGPDMRGRPWYVAARGAGHGVWTDTYKFLGVKEAGDVFGVTYATPLYGEDAQKNKKLIGALTADFDLHGISTFLRTLRVAKTGFAFVVEDRADGTMRVIAHPRDVKEDPVATALLAQSTATREFNDVSFEVGGARYFGGVRPLAGDDVPKWRIGIVVPQSEVLERVERSNRFSIAIALAGMLLSIGAGLYVARQVARPLENLSSEMAKIARLELDPKPIEHSVVEEVDRVAIATENIKTGLRQKKVLEKFVPVGARQEISESDSGIVTLGGRRVRRAILFSDLRGFTSMSERLAPDAVVRILNVYLQEMTKVILEQGGDINEYIGDAILAVFKSSEKAVDAALAMQGALEVLRLVTEDEDVRALKMGIGIHVGDVVEGNIGSAERAKFGVVGDTVNLAARIQDRSREGTMTRVFVSGVVRDEVTTHQYSLIGDLAMKGKAEPVRVFEVSS